MNVFDLNNGFERRQFLMFLEIQAMKESIKEEILRKYLGERMR